MTAEEVLAFLLEKLKENDKIDSASRITGEPALGIATVDGREFFVEVLDA